MIKINQLLPDSLDSIEIGDIYKVKFTYVGYFSIYYLGLNYSFHFKEV